MTRRDPPDFDCLFQRASEHAGYFTTGDAEECGYSRPLLTHHVRGGEFIRVRQGVYRIKNYPSSPEEQLAVEWLAAGTDSAISHESALALLGLSDVVPPTIHVTVPRHRRWYSAPLWVTVHTSKRPLESRETLFRHGVRITNTERSILDAAEWGTQPEQVQKAIEQAVRRRLTTKGRLRKSADDRPRRVRRLVWAAFGDQE